MGGKTFQFFDFRRVEKVVPIAQIELGLKYSIFSQILVPGLLSHGPQHKSHAGVPDHFFLKHFGCCTAFK